MNTTEAFAETLVTRPKRADREFIHKPRFSDATFAAYQPGCALSA